MAIQVGIMEKTAIAPKLYFAINPDTSLLPKIAPVIAVIVKATVYIQPSVICHPLGIVVNTYKKPVERDKAPQRQCNFSVIGFKGPITYVI